MTPPNDPHAAFEAQRLKLGQDRLALFIAHHAEVQAMLLFAVMTVMSAPQLEYHEQVIRQLIVDADDVERAGKQMADGIRELAQAWRQQRDAERAT